MSRCRRFQGMFSSYFDGQLCGRRSRALRAHLDACPDCQRALDGYTRGVEEVSSVWRELIPEPDVDAATDRIMLVLRAEPARATSSLRSRLYGGLRLATAAAACFGLLLLLSQGLGRALAPAALTPDRLRTGHLMSFTVSPAPDGTVKAGLVVRRYSILERGQEGWWPR